MGSPGGGVGSDSPGRGSDEDSRTSNGSDSSQRGMTGSERTQEQAFDDAMNEERERANRPGGPEFGDTTPGYGGPNPDPRGPALGDDRQDEDDEPAPSAATTPDPDDLPFSDTTPPYAGPNPDPRGPALGSGDNDNHAGLIAAGTIGAGFAAADGPFPIGDLIGLGIIGYAGYKAITDLPSSGPFFNQSTEESPDDKTINGHNVGDLTSSGAEPDPADKSGELTKAGRALDKHGGRPGSVFDRPNGIPADKNAEGQKTLEDIVNDKDATVKEGNRFGGFDVYDSDGRGARFDEDGNFRGFLEPPRQ